VLLCGKLHNPAVTCTKALKSSTSSAVIPLCVRKDVEVQKFKLPFKCLSAESPDTDFEFIFIKSVKPADTDLNDFMSTEMRNFRVFECMTFFCLPAVLPVGHANQSTLSVQLQVNRAKLASLPREFLVDQESGAA